MSSDELDLAPCDDGRLQLMRRLCGSMLLAGASVCVASVFTSTTQLGASFQGAMALAFALGGAAAILLNPRAPVLRAAGLPAVVLLGALIATSDPMGVGPFFYLWPVVYTAYFGSPRLLAASFGLMTATLAVALAANPSVPFDADLFIGTVTCVGVMAAVVAAMTRQEAVLRERLALAADTDALTGLVNRRAFDPGLDALVARAGRRDGPLSVVMFDLDRFKRFNDAFGHLEGDRALRRVARILREESRLGDLVSRFGGEEFAVALPGADAESALRYAERVARALAVEPVEPRLRLSTSAGIAACGPGADTAGALLERADEALYASKAAGRTRASWWEQDAIRTGEPFGAAYMRPVSRL